MKFTRKGWGRIFVDKVANIAVVENEINAMSEFEHEYLPDDFIAPFSDYPKLAYTYKFDDLDYLILTARLWKKGIHIFCVDNGMEEHITDPWGNRWSDLEVPINANPIER